jgi:hypothetical protein
MDAATVRFTPQVDGERGELKTGESRRTVAPPRFPATMLLAYEAWRLHSRDASFVFCSRSSRPLGLRNVSRALPAAMIAAA